MANRKRNIQMKFYVTEEEKRLIDEKMANSPRGAKMRLFNPSEMPINTVFSRDNQVSP